MARKLLSLFLALTLLTLIPGIAPADPNDGGNPPRPDPGLYAWMQIDDPIVEGATEHVLWVHCYDYFEGPPTVTVWYNGDPCPTGEPDVYVHGEGWFSLGVPLLLEEIGPEPGELVLEAQAGEFVLEPLYTEVLPQ